jgi:hypothetical protein
LLGSTNCGRAKTSGKLVRGEKRHWSWRSKRFHTHRGRCKTKTFLHTPEGVTEIERRRLSSDDAVRRIGESSDDDAEGGCGGLLSRNHCMWGKIPQKVAAKTIDYSADVRV